MLPLRHRILSAPETIQDLALASNEKYWEGIDLLAGGRRGAGIYLLGYAGEMILKIACFLTDGAQPHELVGPRLGPIRTWAKSQIPDTPHESYHSLRFWLRVLRRKRELLGRQFARQFGVRINQRVYRIHGIWVVGMRYKPDQALHQEVQSVYNDVTWIRDRQPDLVA